MNILYQPSPVHLFARGMWPAFHAENLVMIGAVGMVPHLYIAKKNIGNARKDFPPAAGWKGDLIRDADQLFFKQ